MARGISGAQGRITHAVLEWDGMAVQPHCFGGVEYVMGEQSN
jgi:hypothetical protein